jgi:hypothetical protein
LCPAYHLISQIDEYPKVEEVQYPAFDVGVQRFAVKSEGHGRIGCGGNPVNDDIRAILYSFLISAGRTVLCANVASETHAAPPSTLR